MSSYSASLRLRKLFPGMSYGKLLSKGREYNRSSISMRESASAVDFTIEARDATALRASVNSVLRDIGIVEEASTARIPQKRKK